MIPVKQRKELTTLQQQKLTQELAQDLAALLVQSNLKLPVAKPVPVHYEKPTSKACVVCVGSTGTGKSSTIRKVTRRAVSSGNGRDRVTVRCDKYTTNTSELSEDHLDKYKQVCDLVWVDTVGWDDADLEDDSTFKQILGFINDNKLFKVKAIVWTVAPNVRKDALLVKQARLIDLFRPTEIWNNVIIACKQSRNPDDDTQGALAAAKQFNPDAEPVVLGYTFIDDPSLTDKQRKRFEDPENRDVFLVKTDAEVRATVFKALLSIGKTIKG